MRNPFKTKPTALNSPDNGMSTSSSTPRAFPPVIAQYSGENFVVGGGVAIFHIASGRVVICSAHDRRGTKYYFLPKGRRDAGEESGRGAEREGYEEVSICRTRNDERANRTVITSSLAIVIACSLSPRSTANHKRIPACTPCRSPPRPSGCSSCLLPPGSMLYTGTLRRR